MFDGSAFGSCTSLFKLSAILPSRIPHTSLEIIAAMFDEDLAYLQNLVESKRIELFSKAIFLYLLGCFSILPSCCWPM